MKVVFTSLFQSGMGGGAGRVAHELARAFARQHEVVMVCPAETTGLQSSDRALDIFGVRSAGDDEFHMPVLSGKTVRAIFDFLSDFQPDVVHAHDPALIGLICQVWARMNRVPFVHTAHVLPEKALDFGTTDALNVRLLKSNFSESLTHRVLGDFYTNCDAIIALNQTAKESIRDFGYQGEIFVIPNGRDLAKYQKCSYPRIDVPEKVITFIGYITERKNQLYLLHVLRHLPDNFKLQFVGRALDKKYLKKLQDVQQEYQLDRVEYVGQVPHEQIPDFLCNAHVFPSASKMEVQSLVVIEALASGTPVVGLSNETIDELVDDQVGVHLAKDAEPEKFAAAIERIAALEDEQYQAMCARARKKVDHLDWANIVEGTADAYQQLMKSRPSLTREENDILTSLVSFFTTGEVRSFLMENLVESRQKRKESGKKTLGIPERFFSWIRVPSSTWLISGITILVSILGYVFMKNKRK